MDSLTKPLDDVLQEYSLIELDLEIKIREILDKIQSDFEKVNKYNEKDFNADVESIKENEVLQRNKNFIKNLEQTKAKFRSLYCYQPANDNFNNQIKKYKSYVERKYNSSKHQ